MSTRAATTVDPNKNVWQEISDELEVFRFGKQELGTRAYVGAFNFRGPTREEGRQAVGR